MARSPLHRIRLGYACINLTLAQAGRCSRTCRLANATPKRLEELSRQNLAGLMETLRWNVAHGIAVFRVSSEIIPLASHPSAQWPWRELLRSELRALGEFSARQALRLSMHPGQYTLLNSPRAHVVAASIAELCYHADFLDALDLGSEHKMIIHVGGHYGDRRQALHRFRHVFRELPAHVRRRLVLENDERCFGAEEVLDLATTLGIPMVFDHLHHQASSGNNVSTGLLEHVFATWPSSEHPPEVHFSTQKRNARRGAHDDYIHKEAFLRFLELMPPMNVDVMLEAKGKELALLKLRKSIKPWLERSLLQPTPRSQEHK
jgi:UV DNA damage endonuclease